MLKEWIRRIYPWPTQNHENGPHYRLALDIGTEYVKAIYIELNSDGAKVLGVGRARQDYADMEGGAISSIPGVARCCRQAMTQGSVIAGVKPKEVVLGLAGQYVTGLARTVEKQRSKPERSLTYKELALFVKGAQQEALETVKDEMASKLGFKQMDIELVNSAVVSIRIDGYPVVNPLDFRGRNVEITLFMTFAPLVHASAMRSIANRLELELIAMVAEPYAVAASTLTDEAYEFGSLVIDVGGGSTDIALIQRKGIVGTKMMAMGGRAFTKGIAAHTRKTLRDAEQLKLDYAEGIGVRELESIIGEDLEIWQSALILALRDLYHGTPLPPRVVLCGGGSGLPGIVEAIGHVRLVKAGLFSQVPQVTLLRPKQVFGIADTKEYLTSVQDVTPKSIAFQAALVQAGKGGIIGGAMLG